MYKESNHPICSYVCCLTTCQHAHTPDLLNNKVNHHACTTYVNIAFKIIHLFMHAC